MKQRLSVKEAAKELEVTEAMVRMMCKTGQLGKVIHDGKRSVFLIYRRQVEGIKKDPEATGSKGYEESHGSI